ncbi:MAG TPA: tyrosine-type recombinase/integrase [Gemmataceae bacterium]|nr:tyrosine-type recombinase/integrase [Gemmataceae bacterium]
MTTRKPGSKFPLWLHPSGQWCKKHKGQFYYFGTEPEAAERRYREEWDDIKDGKSPRRAAKSTVLKDLVNEFLSAKRLRVDSGELSARQWAEYHRTGETLVEAFGRLKPVMSIQPSDFGKLRAKAAKRLGPPALAKFVQMVRTLFIFAYKSGLIEVPMRYGDQFDKPPKRVMRLERSRKNAKLIEPADLWKLIEGADVQIRAMILLGLNCGYGQTDCSNLERSDLDARPGWLESPRRKTGIARRCPLWTETAEALKAVAETRPAPHDPADDVCVFLTTRGRRWVRFVDRGIEKRGFRNDTASQAFRRIVGEVGVEVPGGMYTLRHVFRTKADEVKDSAAIDLIMGHADDTMAAVYREKIGDERLQAVVDHVRQWLLAGKPNADSKGQR